MTCLVGMLKNFHVPNAEGSTFPNVEPSSHWASHSISLCAEVFYSLFYRNPVFYEYLREIIIKIANVIIG